MRAALRPFLGSGGKPADAGLQCGPAARALQAEIQSARSQLEAVLPSKLLYAAGAHDPDVTHTFQGTVDQVVRGHKSIVGHDFDCTERACRLSMVIEGDDTRWMDDLRLGLVRTNRNMPLLMVSNGRDVVERAGESPLSQLDVFFRISPIDRLTGKEAETARTMIDALEASARMAAERAP